MLACLRACAHLRSHWQHFPGVDWICNAMLPPFVYGRGYKSHEQVREWSWRAPSSASVRQAHHFPVGVIVYLHKVLAKHDNMSEETTSRDANNATKAIRRHRADVQCTGNLIWLFASPMDHELMWTRCSDALIQKCGTHAGSDMSGHDSCANQMKCLYKWTQTEMPSSWLKHEHTMSWYA